MNDRPYIGIDPGAKGAIALIQGESLHLFDAPMMLVKRGKSKKQTTDFFRLFRLMETLSHLYPDAVATIEKVWGVRGQGGSAGAALGHARAWLEAAVLHGFGRQAELVSPQSWKADLGLYKQPKSASVQLAIVLFPKHAAEFAKIWGKRDAEQCEGRAEAALIAHHARGGRA